MPLLALWQGPPSLASRPGGQLGVGCVPVYEFHSFECLFPANVVFTLCLWNLGRGTSRLRQLFLQAVVVANWLINLYGFGQSGFVWFELPSLLFAS